MNIFMGVMLIAAGTLIVVVGRRTADGRIPRNQFAGIRTKRSMADDASWLTVHRAARPWMTASGAVLALAGAVALAVPSELAGSLSAGIGAIITALLALRGTAAGHAALRSR
ncbi:SdpI family protein [Actinomadura violacea]|uniref:SdpI family protein n=1 Tax=Actinomadura violacea TaxID=2819934 RepID=A0ABS3RRR8_9ACTN|nr:SdpI family protein [Actinomadura violacea]MBO2459455.1 SdpI family protein [Actinomadura violacea]